MPKRQYESVELATKARIEPNEAAPILCVEETPEPPSGKKRERFLALETPEDHQGTNKNTREQTPTLPPRIFLKPILRQPVAQQPINNPQPHQRRQVPAARRTVHFFDEASHYAQASQAHNQSDYQKEKSELLAAIRTCCMNIDNDQFTVVADAARLHNYFELYETCRLNLKEPSDSSVHVELARYFKLIPAEQRTCKDWQHIYSAYIKQADSATTNEDKINIIQTAFIEMLKDKSSERDIYFTRLNDFFLRLYLLYINYQQSNSKAYFPSLSDLYNRIEKVIALIPTMPLLVTANTQQALENTRQKISNALNKNNLVLYYVYLGAMVDKNYEAAINAFLELYARYTQASINTDKINPDFFANTYLKLFSHSRESRYQLIQLQEMATAFVIKKESAFCNSRVLEEYDANQAFLHGIDHQFASECECYLSAIDCARITLEHNQDNESLCTEIGNRLINYCLLLRSNCINQASLTPDIANADSFVNIANKLHELNDEIDFDDDDSNTIRSCENEVNALIAHLHANHYESLRNQSNASWDEKYASIMVVITRNPNQNSYGFIKIAIADMQQDKSSDNNVYYERLALLNVKLFYSIRDSKDFSQEEKKQHYKSVHEALEQLKTQAQSSSRIANCPELMDNLNSWIGVVKFFYDPPPKIQTFTMALPNWRKPDNNRVINNSALNPNGSDFGEYTLTGRFI